MRNILWLRTPSLAAMAFAAVGVMAQETPPEGQAAQEEQEEVVVPNKTNEVSVGYTSFRTNENLSYYARPTEGLALHYLRLLWPATEVSPYTRLTMRGLPEQDNVVDAYMALNNGRSVVRGSRQRHNFYNFDWRPKSDSQDDSTELTLDHAFSTDFGAFVKYREERRDQRHGAPRDPEHVYSKLVAGGVGGKVLGGNLDVTVRDRRTFDDTGRRPETLQRGIDASFARDFGPKLSLEGIAGYTKVEQAGLRDTTARSYAMYGAWDLGEATSLQFSLGRQDSDWNAAQSAHVRKRLLTTARLVHRWPSWSLQLGYKHKETERVRKDQLFVDVPEVDEYDARLAGRLGNARVTLRGSWQDLRASATMQTLDTRQLLWDDRAMFQAKVDAGGELFSAYGVYTYRFQQNKQRDVEIGWHNVTLGGSYMFSPVLNGYAEYALDDFRASGTFENGQELDFFFPNSRSLALGLNWSQGPGWSASAGLNAYESGDVRGTQVTLSLKKRLAKDSDVEFIVAPWAQDDRQLDLTGYRATFLMAKYSVRF